MGKTAFATLLAFIFLAPFPGLQAAPGDIAALGPQDLDRVARGIVRDQSRVAADELAAWLVEGRRDFTLIDVRPAEEYAAGHIESALNIGLTDLLNSEALPTLAGEAKLVLYSDGDRHASLAAVVLNLAGLNAYSLAGGYGHWVEHILNPTKAGDSYAETVDYARRIAIANRLQSCAPMPPVPMPRPATLQPPALVKAGWSPTLEPVGPGDAQPEPVPAEGYWMFSVDGKGAAAAKEKGGYGMFSVEEDGVTKTTAPATVSEPSGARGGPGRYPAIMGGTGHPAAGLIVEEGC